jgi:DNA repair protein RadA/Sms
MASMGKTFTKFVCQQCGAEFSQWFGRCPNCQKWNTLVETRVKERESKRVKGLPTGKREREVELISLDKIRELELKRISTKIEELDRVLGEGIVPGSVTLLAGDPGIGKSTLLLQAASRVVSQARGSVLYVSGEESPQQIKIRAKRLGIQEKNLLFLNETNVDTITETIENIGASENQGKRAENKRSVRRFSGSLSPINHSSVSLVIIDSIQTLWTSDLTGTAGSVGQIRETARRLLDLAKANQLPVFLVGHVTKQGAIAGPMVLAHMVDTVLLLEGERYQALRILRSIKNRFGPTDEVGVFTMTDKGMEEVTNPSKLFLAERRTKTPGSVVTVLMEGTRPLLVEIQALTVPTQLAMPRRVASGVDWNRLQLLIAVLSRRAGLPLGNFDVFVNVAGGIKVNEPGADLAIALAIASAFADKPVHPQSVVVGEVGLLGELRPVAQLEKRLKETRRLGFTQPVTPSQVKTVSQAIRRALKTK